MYELHMPIQEYVPSCLFPNDFDLVKKIFAEYVRSKLIKVSAMTFVASLE